MNQWNNSSYQKIVDAKFTNDIVVVSFENGDIIEVPKKKLIPFGFTDLDWEKVSFNAFEIIIPATPAPFEIPWDKIRVLTDKEFGKYLAERAEQQSKLIGTKIKRLREKKGIKSSELAERAGITAQTISRIEQGHTDVGFTTLGKILASMGYSLKDLANQDSELELENNPKSYNLLLKRMNNVGIDTNLLIRKIIPDKLQVALNSYKTDQPSLLLDEAANYISTIYGWSLNEIWSNQNLILSNQPAKMACFKKPSNANVKQVQAYSHYAYHLAKIVLNASQVRPKYDYPESMDDFKAMYFEKFKVVDFQSLLEFVWDLGICVLPLNDSGVFHGASWNIEGRHVIVLKQNTQFHARWIFDLLHELYHVFTHLTEDNSSVVEVEELSPFSNNESTEELEANAFANQIIFGNRAEEYAEACVNLASWKIENLKKAVTQISNREKIRVDFLSNYLAFRLSYQGENWWGTASKMQVLNPIDNNLLNSALSI